MKRSRRLQPYFACLAFATALTFSSLFYAQADEFTDAPSEALVQKLMDADSRTRAFFELVARSEPQACP